MKEKKKHRLFSGRDYLNDFHQNIKGEYFYTGKIYAFDGSKQAYSQYLTYIITDSVLILGFTAAAEFFEPVKMSRFPLTIVLWLLQFIAASVLAWSCIRTAYRKNPLREYVYRKTAGTLRIKALVTAAISAAAALEMSIYLLLTGLDGNTWPNLIRPLLSVFTVVTAYRLYAYLKTVSWKEIPNEGKDKVAPADMPKL